MADVVAYPDRGVRGGWEVFWNQAVMQAEGRLNRPVATLRAVTLIGKFDQNCHELAAGQQKQRVFVGAASADLNPVS